MPAYDIVMSAEYYDEVTLTDEGAGIADLDTYKGQEIWVNYSRAFRPLFIGV